MPVSRVAARPAVIAGAGTPAGAATTLAESTVDVGRIVARERRARSTRRRAAVALAGLAVAVSVSIRYPEGHDPVRPPGIAASHGPSASASSRTTPDAMPVRLTTKDFGAATLPDQGSLARIVKTGPDRHVVLALYWRDASEVAAGGGNPCDEAPVSEDTCVHAEVGGHSAWIRRWGTRACTGRRWPPASSSRRSSIPAGC